MADFTANFTLSEIETIDATFVINQTPTKTSQLTNDSGFITDADIPTDISTFNNDVGYLVAETDPIFSASEAASITSTDTLNWDSAYTDSHTHSNKALLDTYTQSETDLADAVSKKHTQNTDNTLLSPDGTLTVAYTDNSGALHIDGDIYQEGSAYETHAEQVYTKDNTIILRDGATAGLSSGEYAGFTAKLYDGVNDGYLVFDKDGVAKVGDVGSEQPIATRETLPIDNAVAIWDATTKKFETNSNIYSNGTNIGIGIISPSQKLDVSGNTTSYQYITKQQALTSGTTIACNFNSGGMATFTLANTGATLSNPTNIVAGGRYTLVIKQDATGSRTITTYGSYFKFPGGVAPVLTSTANAVDILEFIADTTTTLRLVNFITDSK